MSWENELKTTVRDLDVPEHRTEFWTELESRLEEASEIGLPRRPPKRPWRVPVAALVAVTTTAVLFVMASPSLTSAVLAYTYPEGTYTYDISYFSVPDPESIEAHGTLTYTVEENSDAGTTTVGVQANVPDVNINCGHPTCPEDLALLRDIPVVRYVLDSTGGFVHAPSSDPYGEEFPELVLPDPLPGSNLYVGLPFGFGPPFPEHALGVGDSWTTTSPRSAAGEDGPQFSAEHTVVGEEAIVGRDTMVIKSDYQTQTGGGGFPVTTQVTVWFDSTAGIIVRAELDRSMTTIGGDEIGTTEIVVELTTQG